MKKSEEDRLKYAVYESTLSTADAVPLPRWGRLRYEDAIFSRHNACPNREGQEEAASPSKKEANPASLCSAAPSKGRGSRGHSLLPMEGGAPKGRRLDGGKRYERERGRSSQVRHYTRAPYPPLRGPPSPNHHALRHHCERKRISAIIRVETTT